ncbi:hypothetical protein [Schaalia turicensis]|uniref:hypothetical protein n=1 Tax=Schaalia turicensis TaxID=131111 RepID=UPI001E2A0819|nr:hypothetical protein [Schaalia turicensis]
MTSSIEQLEPRPTRFIPDNAIHSAAGLQLRNECAEIMQGAHEPTGQARDRLGTLARI